ncbi:hypothetical protein GLAREA_00237 [Glarea lozoyensis ATCC 20868]|uniref:Uncharacterized protein n=1 Tax=Glarea lozoyensis (strain ATCC 20868 / MF5171) TaxID=1116229 RepID=S3CVV6_GLAL2|nr:uncharacterized protein GLAREA_00237 [Glarea lozoyensis ATCC 20868]EPE29079.1 hypothetical protein GLAREA_00237 [Glarea lozoyensis ATCC 20868]
MATPLNNQKVYPGIYKNRDGYPMLIKTLSIWVASILPHPTSRKRASKLKTKYHRTKISGGVAANEDPSATLNKFVGLSESSDSCSSTPQARRRLPSSERLPGVTTAYSDDAPRKIEVERWHPPFNRTLLTLLQVRQPTLLQALKPLQRHQAHLNIFKRRNSSLDLIGGNAPTRDEAGATASTFQPYAINAASSASASPATCVRSSSTRPGTLDHLQKETLNAGEADHFDTFTGDWE